MSSSEIKLSGEDNLFSKLSITLSGLTLILIILLINSVPSTIKTNESAPIIPKWLIISTVISCFLGVIFSVVSIWRKERLKYLKTIGSVLNVLLFLFLIVVVGFALMMDWKRGQ